MIFSRDYLRVFIPLAILFAIYHVTFVPWIEQKGYQSEKKWTSQVLPDSEEWWDVHFKADAWQRQAPKVLTTKSSTLLFQEKVELSDTRWHIKPLTILIPQRSSGTNKRSIIISNPEGAEIQFQHAPDMASEPPPVESGRMRGMIRIYVPPDENSEDNGLVVDTSEVRIEKRQIWTDKSIRMEMGDSLIEGHFLTINMEQRLLSAEPSIAPREKSPFDGLETLELTYVDRVRVGLKNGGLWPSKKISNPQSLAAHATLRCGGRFTFSFLQSEATLRGGVHMEHHVGDLPIDTFDCEELTMQIGLQSEPATPPPGGENRKAPWKLEKLTAVGGMGKSPTDRTRWLKLVAPGMQVEAMGQRLDMDFLTGEINLSNTLPLNAVQESAPVYLRHESMQMWSPEIHYGNLDLLARATDGARTKTLDRLGTVVASGPGAAQMDSKEETWKLSWGQRLLIRPMEQLDVVTVIGNANVNHSNQGNFYADKLDLWLRPTEESRRSLLGGYYENGNVPKWLPEAMKAEGVVRVESPQLIARVDSMNLHFTYPTSAKATPSQSVPPQSNALGSIELTSSAPKFPPSNDILNASSPLSGLSTLPAGEQRVRQPSHGAIGVDSDSQKPSPYRVAAKTLQTTIHSVGNKSGVEALSLDGDFEMRREMLTESSPWPFSARGNQLRMRETAPNLVNMHLSGQPAKVTLGTGEIVAPELQLSQSENIFHIDHPGVLVIPPEAIPLQSTPNGTSLASTTVQGLPMTLGGNSRNSRDTDNRQVLQWVEAPRLQWGERMTFDGRTARFGGGIDFTCRIQNAADTISHIMVLSKSLAVDLIAPIPLSTTNSGSSEKAQVNLIRFEEDVDIKVAQTGLDNVRQSTEHIKLPRLDINVPDQTFLGYGPGELWSRRYSSSGSFSGFGPSAGPTNVTTGNGKPDRLQCVHLSFMGRLDGDLKTRKANFYDRIEALMGPIDSWEDQVNVHLAERLGPNQTSIISDQLNIFDGSQLSYNQISPSNRTGTPAAAWEIEAVSRVRLESMTDKGRVTMEGHSLKYGAKDDHVQVVGSPTQSALFTMYPLNGNQNDVQEYRLSNISMQLKTGSIKGNIDRIQGALPAEFQRAGTPSVAPPANTNILPDPRSFKRN